ncbi:OsmC family protein [Zooshikella sp. RANM57]|uniref:OsmC family protein n=1 Tax=Zooshikella sp. RANM57 TaxID=3425863 RepID=UPI003D6E8703
MATKHVNVTATMGESFLIKTTVGKHELILDQPEQAGGTDQGPNPLEYFFVSLAGCVASIARIKAKQDKVNLRSMTVNVSGDLNPAGLLGKPTDDRTGFDTINIAVTMDADLSQEEKQQFIDDVCERCPVHENIKHLTTVSHTTE